MILLIVLYLAAAYFWFCTLTFGVLCYTLSKDTMIDMSHLQTYGSIIFASVVPVLNILALYGAILILLEDE